MLSLNDLKSSLSCKISPKFTADGTANANVATLRNIPDHHHNHNPYRPASVLIIIHDSKEPAVIMTKKSKHLRIHASEISFPGGKLEDDDGYDLLQAALRETDEEIGLHVGRDMVTGQLGSVITLNSNFLIMPFVCVMESVPPLLANPLEVEQIFHIPLESMLATIQPDTDPSHNLIREMYTFTYKNQTIWGASARILKQISDRIAPS